MKRLWILALLLLFWNCDTATTDGNSSPVAAFTSTVTDLTAAFDASGSTDSDGSIVSFTWTFGDGSTGSGVTVSHTYTAPGEYTVTLTVTDDLGDSTELSKQISVGIAADLVAAFTTTITELSVAFDGTSSSGGNITAFTWDFGDATTGTGAIVNHTYATSGSYNVTLTITDDQSNTDSEIKSITVTGPSNSEITEQKLAEGAAAISNGDYSAAMTAFSEALSTAESADHKSAAHTGLGFSQMRLSGEDDSQNLYDDAYTSLENALTEVDGNNQAKSIKVLMDYSYKGNYQLAITLGKSVMDSDPNFEFILDPSINIKDVILHKALSEFALRLFEECLKSIQILDPDYPNPQKMEEELRIKLEELIKEFD